MDPTTQRRQRPLKVALDAFVFVVATYLLPTFTTFVLLNLLCMLGFSIPAAALWGSLFYFVAIYEAVTQYRRHLALPRAIDFSLDPPVSDYLGLLVGRICFVLLLPSLLLMFPFANQHPFLVFAGVLGLWGYVLVRETAIGQLRGQPSLLAGSLGIRIKPVRLVRDLVRRLYGRSSLTFPWGGVDLPLDELLKNILLIGAVGTGKTLIIIAFLARLLPCVYRFPNWRVVLVDPKGDLAPWAMNLLPRHKIQLVNPGSHETYVWDIARDTAGRPSSIQQLSHGLVQVIEETQPFFTDAARAVLQAIMLALSLQAPDAWWFSDVFFVASSRKRTEVLLALHSSTRQVFDTYAANTRVMNDVFATLSSRLSDFMPIAALWSHVQREHPERTFSVKDFVRGNSLLLIQMQASASVSQGKLFALLLGRLSQELLDQETGQSTLPPEHARRTIVVIDEAPRVGDVNLIDVATNGRDYGVGLLVAMQSIDAMTQYYSREKLDALMNEFHTMGFLSANSPTTLKWMVERLGNSDSRLPPSDSTQAHDAAGEWNSTLDPSQFHTLRQGQNIGPGCIPGIFTNSQLGAWYCDEGVHLPERPTPSTTRPIPDDWHELRPWDNDDLKRLNLTRFKSQLDLDPDAPGNSPSGSARPPRPRSPRPSPTQVPRFRP